MPSLNALREFKASLANIGGQKAALEAKGIPFDDFELPASDPPSMQEPAGEGSGTTAERGLPPLPVTPVSPSGDLDFSAFLGSQPDNIPGGGPATQGPAGRKTEPSTEDLYFPEELLSGISLEPDEDLPDEDMPESIDAEIPDNLNDFTLPERTAFANGISVGDDEAVGIDSLDDFVPADEPELADGGEPLDADGLDDLALPGEAAQADDDEAIEIDGLDDLVLPDEMALADGGESPDADSLGDLALPGEAAQADDDEAIEIDGLDDLVLPDEMALADGGEPLDADGLGDPALPGETAQADDDEVIDIDGLDDLVLTDEPELADGGEPLDTDGLDDLALPDEAALEDDGQPLDIDGLDDLVLPDEMVLADGGESPHADRLDDLALPDPPPLAGAAESLDADGLDDLALPDETALVDDGQPLDIDGLDDFALPDETALVDDGQPLDIDGLDDFALPDEAATADGGEPLDTDGLDDLALPDEPMLADGGEPLDIDGLDDFALPDEPALADGGEPLDIDGLDDLVLPDDTALADGGKPLDADGLDDLALPDETALADGDEPLDDIDGLDDFALPDETALADSGKPLDIDGLDDFALPDEAALVDDGQPLDIDGLDDLALPDEAATADGGEPLDADGLDDFALPDEPALADGISADDSEAFDSLEQSDPKSGAGQASDGGIDDLSFAGMEQGSEESPAGIAGGAGKDKGSGKRRPGGEKAMLNPHPEFVEDIKLSDEEMQCLEETLTSYPLNLRIACEEIIADNIVSPEQMSRLLGHLIRGVSARETASYASQLLGKTINIPKSYQARSGEALEARQATFSYIFVHNFLPVLRIFMLIAVAAASLFYLIYKFVYTPLMAESIYKIGYERIFAGEYQRANERFSEAFNIHRRKDWFYRYAEAFRDQRQYIYAEQKYDELLRYYPRDKKGVLDYAYLETYYLRNYAKADNLLHRQLLDFAPDDPEGLLAAGDNNLAWGEIEPERYEDARYAYARLMDKYGWTPPVVERMMKYFIRTDNLKEVLPLRQWFDSDPKRRTLSAGTLAELGGYLLDKQLEETRGVPNEYVEHINSVRDLLLRAVMADTSLPEAHYHLARYYKSLGNAHEERVTLELATRAFDRAQEESIQRLSYRIDAHQRYADNLINSKEFFPAEEQLIKGISLYEDAISRHLLSRSPRYGRLYSGLGDLEYFTKGRDDRIGDMEAALRFYHRAEQNGWAPAEMRYRMGAAYYQLEDWKKALEYLFSASSNLPLNRRVLYALGNAAVKRGDYFAAQGYYNRLLDILEVQRSRLPLLLPNDRPEFHETAERLMWARNNAGVVNEMLAAQTGNRNYHTRAMAFYAEASRAWDSLTRDPRTMVRLGVPPLPYANAQNALRPQANYEPQIFIRIDRDALETSVWEDIAPLERENRSGN
ncbi:MAG: tetratricopeptide repeat protein [Treponema sp.]|jgi:hypothetical protein|nr:tetratricopeptide repeat protein [Treponema sp.]